MPRRDPPDSTRQRVLAEAGYFCANPRCRHILTLQLHHIVWVKDDGGNEPSNLLALCPNCHSLHTQGHIKPDAILLWKGLLLALNHAFDRDSMDLLLYLHKQDYPMYYTADGVLRFARLIANGLARSELGHEAIGSVFYSGHRVSLTSKGERLLEAWLDGDQEKYRLLLTESNADAR